MYRGSRREQRIAAAAGTSTQQQEALRFIPPASVIGNPRRVNRRLGVRLVVVIFQVRQTLVVAIRLHAKHQTCAHTGWGGGGIKDYKTPSKAGEG